MEGQSAHTHKYKGLCHSNAGWVGHRKRNAKERERLCSPEASTSNSLTAFVRRKRTGQICPVATLAYTAHPSGMHVCEGQSNHSHTSWWDCCYLRAPMLTYVHTNLKCSTTTVPLPLGMCLIYVAAPSRND